MPNTRGVSSFNDLNTNNTRSLVRKMCILLYCIHGPPVFSILGVDDHLVHVERRLPPRGIGREEDSPLVPAEAVLCVQTWVVATLLHAERLDLGC